ncbi:MAG: 2-phospho-L-lactate transferase CofD family protein, partial [Halobacteria archaeon]|nr:2-phospho-L-lactate transferase CofD family protein [Halobacteria archaeon]
MVTFLSGGTGTPKLLDGARDVLDGFSVVVNTGDDVEISGNLVCPDIDTVLYTLADEIDREKWWGVKGDSHETHERLRGLGGARVERVEASRRISEGRAFSGAGEFMRIGDRDRATHVHRTGLMDEGATLTEATRELADSLGVDAGFDVLPMSDSPVSTYVETDEGWTHFQVFWVAEGGEPDVYEVEFRHDDAEPTDEVLDALGDSVV